MIDISKQPMGWHDLMHVPPESRTWRHGGRTFGRKLFARLPAEPRCKLCSAPFAGIGGRLVGPLGFRPSTLTPFMCGKCDTLARREGGGTEVDATVLFADIRGSTQLAERMSPKQFSDLIDRFFRESTHVLTRSDALIEKLVGDEVTAVFVPGFAGADHARKAAEAARELLRRTGHRPGKEPWAPTGIGLHHGRVFVGVVGEDAGVQHFAVLGDPANVAARLATAAGVGEILVSDEAVAAAALATDGLERRELSLKGKSAPMPIWVISA